MGGATPGKQDKHNLNIDLNLVPFIDLLSSLVLFLLLSVVWIRVAAIQTSVDAKGKSTVSITDQSKLMVRVHKDGFALTWPSSISSMPNSVHHLEDLAAHFQRLMKAGKTLPPATVSGDDSVEYGLVVQALDTLRSEGLNLVTLSTE